MLTVADIVTSGIAALALLLGIINYIEAREPRVLWSLQPDPDGSEHGLDFRLANTGRRFAGVIITIDDPDADGKTHSIIQPPTFPVTIEPGNSIPLAIWQFDGRPPARITVTWRQRRATGWWVRPFRRKITLYR